MIRALVSTSLASIYAPKGLFSMPEGVDSLFFRFTVGYYNMADVTNKTCPHSAVGIMNEGKCDLGKM